MTWEYYYEYVDGFTYIYVFDSENEEKKILVYKIDKKNSIIEYYPKNKERYILKKIILEGFNSLPREFLPKGLMKGGGDYYVNKKVIEGKIDSLIISKIRSNSLEQISKTDM